MSETQAKILVAMWGLYLVGSLWALVLAPSYDKLSKRWLLYRAAILASVVAMLPSLGAGAAAAGVWIGILQMDKCATFNTSDCHRA